jgi:hypothetical protein
MSKRTTYTATFRTDRDCATEDIPAASPEAALAKARAIADDPDRLNELYFEPYSDAVPVDEIVVDDPHGERVAEWISDDLLLRLAAGDLFDALERALAALHAAPCFAVPRLGTDSDAIAAACRRAIAKGGNANRA